METYQLKLTPAYIQDNLQREQAKQFQMDKLLDEHGLIRVRMYSRFRNITKYQLWIAYIEEDFNWQENEDFADEEPNESILGYWCTCKTGAGKLGSCAHIASILWYLGYARHQPQRIKYPTTALLENVIDVGHRY